MRTLTLVTCLLFYIQAVAQQPAKFYGIDASLGNLFRLSDAKTRSIPGGIYADGSVFGCGLFPYTISQGESIALKK